MSWAFSPAVSLREDMVQRKHSHAVSLMEGGHLEQHEHDLETLESLGVFDLDDLERMFSEMQEAC